MQVGFRASGGDAVRLRERQAQPRNFDFFFQKSEQVAEAVAIEVSFL